MGFFPCMIHNKKISIEKINNCIVGLLSVQNHSIPCTASQISFLYTLAIDQGNTTTLLLCLLENVCHFV